jgi:hypothetical protein
MNNSEKAFSLLDVYKKVKEVCEAHVSISHFDSGTELEYGNSKEYTYPLSYLEEVVLIQNGEKKRTHVYDLALSILDRLPKDATREDRILIQDKCFQIFNEVYQYLSDYVFGKERVSEFSVVVTPDFSTDDTMRVRADFKVQVGNPLTTKTPTQDLKQVFPTLS